MRPSLSRDVVHLTVCWCLAVTQPLLSLLGQQPQFLVAQGITGFSLIAFATLLTLAIPAGLALVLALVRAVSPVACKVLLHALITAFLALACLPLVADFNPYLAIGAAVLSAAALAWLRARTATGRLFADVASLGIVIFPLAFLWFSPARDLLTGRSAAPSSELQAAPNPVFVFVFDEFPLASILDRNLQIDAGRYPGFAALAAASTWYRYATTVSDATVIAVPAALSGYFPAGDKQRLAVHSQYPDTLFTLLGASHSVHAHESGTQLCPPRVCSRPDNGFVHATLGPDLWVVYQHLILPERWKAHLPSIQEGWTGFGAGPTADGAEPVSDAEQMHQRMDWTGRLRRLRGFLGEIQELPGNTFHFYHALLPHAPWVFLPDGRSYAYLEPEGVVGVRPLSDPAPMKHTWYPDPVATDLGQRRHLLQVGAVDSLIGEILGAIRASGHFDEALIIITGDHGAAFQPGVSRRAASAENFAAIAGIPLFVKYPRQDRGAIVDTPARLADLAPTVLHALGVSPPENMDGLPLQTLDRASRDSIRLVNDERQILELDLADYRAQLAELAALQAQRYGEGGFETVIRPDLLAADTPLGHRLEDFGQIATGGARVKVRNPGLYSGYAGQTFVPLYLRGTIDGVESLPHPGRILIAAKGRIVASAEPFRSPQLTDQFATLLPAESILAGLAFYWHSASVPESLIALQDPCSAARLVDGDDRAYLATGCLDERQAILAGAYHGEVSTAQRDDGMIGLSGWSGNTLSGELPQEVLVFIDGVAVARLLPELERPDLVARFGLPALGRAGFHAVLSDPTGSADLRTLRVVARGSAGATELSYPKAGTGYWPFAAPPEADPTPIPVNFRAGARARLASGELAFPGGPGTPYRLGDSLDMAADQAAAHLLGAWHPASGGTRWAGLRMALAFAVGPDPGDLKLTMKVRAFLAGGNVPAQRLQVRVGDSLLADLLIEATGPHDIEVLVPAAARGDDGLLVLEMDAPLAAVPKEVGVSADLRRLSFAFQEVRLSHP